MAAPNNHSQDPFLPAGSEAEAPDSAQLPSRAKQTVDITPPPRLAQIAAPERRKPLKYRKQGTSWVTVVILAFAAVGMAAVGGTALKKVFGTKEQSAVGKAEQAQAKKAASYTTISRDDAVLVTVVVSPRDARLMLDGEHTVSNPLRLLRSKTAHKLSISAPGYAPAIHEVVPDNHKTIKLALKKQNKAPAGR